jgi:hypothetical protein
MGLVGRTAAGVQGDEVPDVGGDKRPSLSCRVRENLVIWEPHQGFIGDNRDDVVALGAELLGDVVGEHLVQQQRLSHGLPGQELALAQPGLLGGFLRSLGGGDLRVDLVWVGSPVADRCGQQAQCYPGVLAD